MLVGLGLRARQKGPAGYEHLGVAGSIRQGKKGGRESEERWEIRRKYTNRKAVVCSKQAGRKAVASRQVGRL